MGMPNVPVILAGAVAKGAFEAGALKGAIGWAGRERATDVLKTRWS